MTRNVTYSSSNSFSSWSRKSSDTTSVANSSQSTSARFVSISKNCRPAQRLVEYTVRRAVLGTHPST